MSRSRKKVPIHGICADSDKKDKRAANRRYRRITKNALNCGRSLPTLREVSDIWSFAKDGKIYTPNDKKILRK